MERSNDLVILCGEAAGRPVLSHSGREGVYYKFPLAVERLSGAVDTLNVLVTEEQLGLLEPDGEPRITVRGEVRSYNNRSGIGPRLVISVLARELRFSHEDFRNRVYLSGTLCKAPNLRRTPMGREICDIMLAVNRHSGRSDYLPVIAWGSQARAAARWPVGTKVELEGRLQSRVYIKAEGESLVEKTAFEISAVTLAELPPEEDTAHGYDNTAPTL